MKISHKRSPMATVAKGVAVAAASVALAFANTAPAAAHGGHWIYVYTPNMVTAGSGIWSGDWITYCDDHVDGNRVRLQLLQYNGTVSYSGWAPSQACNSEGGRTGYKYRVCAENIGCSAWHNRY